MTTTMTPSPWKPIESAPIGEWIWVIYNGSGSPRYFKFGSQEALTLRIASDRLTHWMEPIKTPKEAYHFVLKLAQERKEN